MGPDAWGQMASVNRDDRTMKARNDYRMSHGAVDHGKPEEVREYESEVVIHGHPAPAKEQEPIGRDFD